MSKLYRHCILLIFIILLYPGILHAAIDEGKFADLNGLINQGDYEDALRIGKKKYNHYHDKDAGMFTISASLLSSATYLWYDFKASDTYFNEGFNTWKNMGSPWEDKYIAGLYLAKTAIQRNEPLKAIEILKLTASFGKNSGLYAFRLKITMAEALNETGDYLQALTELEKAQPLLFEITQEDKTIKAEVLEYTMLIQKAHINIGYGNWPEADSALLQIKRLRQIHKLNGSGYDFEQKNLQAKLFFIKKDFRNAFSVYLDAYNTLEANDQEYRKYSALKMATVAAGKSGWQTDFAKLLRRADMFSMKKSGRSHIFVTGLSSLRMETLLESGQYELLLSRTGDILKKYDFLPKSHPDHITFLEMKAEAAEAAGDLKIYLSTLDALENIAIAKYGVTSVKTDEIKLKKAAYEWKYGGGLSNALLDYRKYYDDNYSKKIYTYSPAHLDKLEGYTHVYEYLDKPDSALKKAILAYEIANVALGRISVEANYFLSLSAIHKFNSGKYTAAIEGISSAYRENQSLNKDFNGQLTKACYLQASLFEWIGEYESMDKQIDKAYSLTLQKEEKKFYENFEVLEEVANAYIAKSNFYKAERNLRNSLTIKKEKAGDESFLMIAPTLAMAQMKIQKGELKDAEKHLDKGEKLVKTYFSAQSEQMAVYYYLRSRYYSAIADFKKAKDLLLQSINITSGIYGDSHIRLFRLYIEMANIQINENNLTQADATYEKAKKNVEGSLGNLSPAYADLLVQHAELLTKMNAFDKAASYLNDAEKFWKAKLGEENVNIAGIEFVRGDMYYKQGRYTDADKSYRHSANMFSSIFNKKHTGYLKAITGLAKVAYMKKAYKDAADLMEPVLDERIRFTVNNFSIMTFKQKTNFWAGFREEFEFYNSIAYKLISGKTDQRKAANVYNYALRTKGLLLTSDAQIRRQVYQSGDSALVANFNEWQFQKEYFATVSYYSSAQLSGENISLDKINQRIEELEKKIQAKSDVNFSTNSKEVTWIDIKKALPEKGTALEMVRFRYFNKNFTDTIIYMSLIADAKTKDYPQVVLMPDGKNLEGKWLKYYRNATISKSDDEYSFNAFLAPIKTKIPDGNTIYFSGEGVYTQINPEMLYNTITETYALQTNDFVFVTNTKDILPDEQKTNTINENKQQFYLYGNPAFYVEKLKEGKESLPSLDGAEKEILEIAKILQTNNRVNTHMTGMPITEDTIRSLQAPYVLHISTHGYFMERKSGNELISNPMLNSGLLLTGSGNILDSKEGGYINQKQGILTASEVMDLNFSKTDLVVLSACETGRGQVEVGEGVYGLQRAFLVAGAKAIVLSLFKVDDEATKLLMIKFYTKFLSNGGDHRKAFREAKQEIRQSEFKSPVYWGAFIMIEGKQGKGALN